TVRPAVKSHVEGGSGAAEADPIAELMAQSMSEAAVRHSEASLLRQALVWLGVGALVVLAAAAGIFAYQYLQDRADLDVDAVPTIDAGAAVEPPAARAEPEIVPRAIESPIPYSVQVEAHQDPQTAAERVAALRRAEPGMEFYLAPANVAGAIYYRVLAGPAADLSMAQTLMQRLVDAGHKASAEAWSLVPTRWAFRIAR